MHLIVATSESELGLPVEAGTEVRLRFRHSIYGSSVEEAFAICADGLETRRFCYEEPRLAEYYGHDGGRRDGAWWVVDSERQLVPSLALRVTPQSRMRLTVGDVTIDLTQLVRAGGRIKLSVARDGA